MVFAGSEETITLHINHTRSIVDQALLRTQPSPQARLTPPPGPGIRVLQAAPNRRGASALLPPRRQALPPRSGLSPPPPHPPTHPPTSAPHPPSSSPIPSRTQPQAGRSRHHGDLAMKLPSVGAVRPRQIRSQRFSFRTPSPWALAPYPPSIALPPRYSPLPAASAHGPTRLCLRVCFCRDGRRGHSDCLCARIVWPRAADFGGATRGDCTRVVHSGDRALGWWREDWIRLGDD